MANTGPLISCQHSRANKYFILIRHHFISALFSKTRTQKCYNYNNLIDIKKLQLHQGTSILNEAIIPFNTSLFQALSSYERVKEKG